MKHKYLETHREEERTGKVDQKSAKHCDVPGWAAGPPWPFPLWASIPPFLGITLQAGGGARGSFHPTVGSVGLLKSSLKTLIYPDPRVQHEDETPHPPASSPGLLRHCLPMKKRVVCTILLQQLDSPVP